MIRISFQWIMDLIILETSSYLWDNVERDSFILSGTHPADHQWVLGTRCVKHLAGPSYITAF